MPGAANLYLCFRAGRGGEVSTKEDRFERRVSTFVESCSVPHSKRPGAAAAINRARLSCIMRALVRTYIFSQAVPAGLDSEENLDD